jgi:hypothetical protein
MEKVEEGELSFRSLILYLKINYYFSRFKEAPGA